MKILYIKEEEVQQLVTVPEVIETLEAAFGDQAKGRAFTNSRNRLRMPGTTLHIMAAPFRAISDTRPTRSAPARRSSCSFCTTHRQPTSSQ